jgi:hypothetical protein
MDTDSLRSRKLAETILRKKAPVITTHVGQDVQPEMIWQCHDT